MENGDGRFAFLHRINKKYRKQNWCRFAFIPWAKYICSTESNFAEQKGGMIESNTGKENGKWMKKLTAFYGKFKKR